MTKEEKDKLIAEGKSEIEIMQLEKIAEMKEKLDSMVDPVEHEKLKEQYKLAMDEFVNRRPAPKTEEPTVAPVKDLAKKLSSIKDGNISNREYIKTALEYRKAHIKETGRDPFTDFGENGPQAPNEETERVAKILQQVVDNNESSTSFRIALNDVLRDDPKLAQSLARKRA